MIKRRAGLIRSAILPAQTPALPRPAGANL